MSDPDGGPYTLSGTFTKDGGAVTNIPSGILSFPVADSLRWASTSYADIGTYQITIYAKDPGNLQTTGITFTLSITNAAPTLVSTAPPNWSMAHGSSTTINLSTTYTDPDGDAITMTGTYSYNGGASLPLPGGIFTVPSSFMIGVTSLSIADVGVYTITLTISDP